MVLQPKHQQIFCSHLEQLYRHIDTKLAAQKHILESLSGNVLPGEWYTRNDDIKKRENNIEDIDNILNEGVYIEDDVNNVFVMSLIWENINNLSLELRQYLSVDNLRKLVDRLKESMECIKHNHPLIYKYQTANAILNRKTQDRSNRKDIYVECYKYLPDEMWIFIKEKLENIIQSHQEKGDKWTGLSSGFNGWYHKYTTVCKLLWHNPQVTLTWENIIQTNKELLGNNWLEIDKDWNLVWVSK